MGKYNSSLTRVVPLIDQLKTDTDFINKVVNVLNTEIVISEKPLKISYGEKEEVIMPSKKFLKHLVNNNSLLNSLALGIDDGSVTYLKRKKILENNVQTISEALFMIDSDPTCLNKWYVFEGYTHPDIFIETNSYIIIGEAKRTERGFTTKTKWLNDRDQLIRHIDAVLDSKKKIISFLIIDESLVCSIEYKQGLNNYSDIEYFIKNLPHRNSDEIEIAFNSYIGYTTWQKYQKQYGIEYIDTIENNA